MVIRSNIQDVIGRLKRVEAELPKAVERAVGPKYWKTSLEFCARKTLRAQWVNERNVKLRAFYERMTDRMVATIMDQTFESGIRYLMSTPPTPGAASPVTAPFDIPAAADYNLGRRTPMGRLTKEASMGDESALHPEQIENLDRVRQLVLDWVTLEKNLDPARDYNKDGTPLSPQEIAERIEEILGINAGAVPGARSELMKHAAAKLTEAIQSWLDGEASSTPAPNYQGGVAPGTAAAMVSGVPAASGGASATPALTFPPGVAEQWLAAVLAAWKALLLSRLSHRLDYEIFKTFSKVRSELSL